MKGPTILYSFPYSIGAGQVCNTAWQHVNAVTNTGARVITSCGSFKRGLPLCVESRSTLKLGKLRVPIRLLGRNNALRIHDWKTSKWLSRNYNKIDAVHTWPRASIRTMTVARKHGIPAFYERPNAHTEYAFKAVDNEIQRLGITLPRSHHHKPDAKILAHENKEYELANYLLCPSDFVAKTHLQYGIPAEKLIKHGYGYDPKTFYPKSDFERQSNKKLKILFASYCEPRKGLHYAIEAWKRSNVCDETELIVCGDFVPSYRQAIEASLSHPNLSLLGHRKDIAEIMRECEIFTLPTVEEGSALVTYEAKASGCALAVSDASGAKCRHEHDALVHRAQNVDELASHLQRLVREPDLLKRLRSQALNEINKLTWEESGKALAQIYNKHIQAKAYLK